MSLAPELDEAIQRASDRMREDWEEQLDRLLLDWRAITELQTVELEAQVRSIAESNDITRLTELSVPLNEAHTLLLQYLMAMYQVGEDQIQNEAEEQGAVDTRSRFRPVALLTFDMIDLLTALAQTIVVLLGEGLCAAVAREILRLWGTRPDPASLSEAARTFIESLSDRALRDQLGGGLTNAMNKGRFGSALTAKAAAWYATERNDRSACGPCRDIDETRFYTLEAAVAAYPAGGYVRCEGGVRCRGGVVPVWAAS